MHSVFGKINYGGLKHNSLYLGLVQPSGVVGDRASLAPVSDEDKKFYDVDVRTTTASTSTKPTRCPSSAPSGARSATGQADHR